MFGELTVFARPTAPAARDDGPTFPLYLLPSLQLPFRRRRTSPVQQSPSSSVAQDDDESASVPSLSSSPGTDTPGSSPGSLKSFFPSFPSLGSHYGNPQKDVKQAIPAAPTGRRRLVRIQADTLRCNGCATDIAFVSQIVSKGFTGRHGRAYLVAPPSPQPTHNCPGSPLNERGKFPGTTEADLVNIRVGSPESRQLVTGAHTVADIWCIICGSKLGWKYVDAREQEQKYKVGKFILETQRVSTHHGWEDVEEGLEEEVMLRAVGDYGHGSGDSRGLGGGSVRSSSDTYSSAPSTPHRGSEDTDIREEEDDMAIDFDSEDEDECDDIFAGVWDPKVVAKRRRGRVSNLRAQNRGAV